MDNNYFVLIPFTISLLCAVFLSWQGFGTWKTFLMPALIWWLATAVLFGLSIN